MTLLRWLWRIVGCHHAAAVREIRRIDHVDRWCFVCPTCGDVRPMLHTARYAGARGTGRASEMSGR